MITTEAPYYVVKGIMVLRDHQDPDQFYYLPSGVQLAARDGGGLAFTLFKYRADLAADGSDPTRARGGGLALLETEIPAPPLAVLTAEVSAQSGRERARISPVVFRSATAHALIAHGDGPQLVTDLLAEHGAPLTAPFHTAFTLGLTPAGATLIEQAARGGSLPVGIAYELRLLALTPALHAHVTMHYDQAWDRFSASVGWTYVVKAQLDVELAWLVEHDVLHIDITEFTDDADKDRQYKAVMALVTARVQGDFFRTAIPPDGQDAAAQPGPLTQYIAQGSGTNVTSATAYFVLKAKYEATRDTKTFELTWNGAIAVELVHAVAGTVATMVRARGDDSPPPDIREIDGTDPFFATLQGQVVGAFDFDAWADLREAVVTLVHGDRRDAFVFARGTPGPFAFRYPLASPLDDVYQYDVRYDFDAATGAGPIQIAVPATAVRDRVLVIDPHAHVQYRAIRFVLGPVDRARVPRMHVTLTVTGASAAIPRAAFALDATAPEHVFRLRLPAPTEAAPGAPIVVRARTQWEDPAGGVHDAADELVTGDSYVVLGPYRDLLDVLVVPACDFATVSQLLVTLRHDDGDQVFERVLTFDAAGKGASQHVEVPLVDPKARAYQYRVATFRTDGTRDETDWQTDDAPVLVVGGVKRTTATVSIVWVGSPGAALGMRVDLWATGPDGNEQQLSAFLRPGQTDPVKLEVPLGDGGQLAYRYEIHAITAAGEQAVRADRSVAPLLVVQMPAG